MNNIFTIVYCYVTFCSHRWLPACAALFIERKDLWQHLVPDNDTESTLLVQQYFACVAALMSLHLRSTVINSLHEFLDFLLIHKVGHLHHQLTA